MKSENNKNRKKTGSIHKVFFYGLLSLGVLIRSRKRILKDFYINTLRHHKIDHDETISLEEARRLCKESPKLEFLRSDYDGDSLDRLFIRHTRLTNAWSFLWANAIPILVAVLVVKNYLGKAKGGNAASIFIAISLFLATCYFFSIIGLIVQSILIKPFYALIGIKFIEKKSNGENSDG